MDARTNFCINSWRIESGLVKRGSGNGKGRVKRDMQNLFRDDSNVDFIIFETLLLRQLGAFPCLTMIKASPIGDCPSNQFYDSIINSTCLIATRAGMVMQRSRPYRKRRRKNLKVFWITNVVNRASIEKCHHKASDDPWHQFVCIAFFVSFSLNKALK